MNIQRGKLSITLFFAFFFLFQAGQVKAQMCGTMCDDNNILKWYRVGLCSNPAPPSICFCKYLGEHWYSLEFCNYVDRSADASSDSALAKIDYDQVVNFPVSLVVGPLSQSTTTHLLMGNDPLMVAANPRSLISERARISDSQVQKPRSSLKMCKEDCDKAMKWALEMAVEGDFSAGFYLKTAGENGGFLHWSDSTGLAMWPTNEGLSEEEHSGLLWIVGSGEFQEGKTSGYRIMRYNDLLKGLVVNKQTGAVEVAPVFVPGKETLVIEGEEINKIELNPDYRSVWRLGDLEPTDILAPVQKSEQKLPSKGQ